jgi:small-conductance mechanosensitive channel
MKLAELLQGKKTYITSVLVALYTLLKAFGVVEVTPEQDMAVYGLLAAAFGVALRDAISKQSK